MKPLLETAAPATVRIDAAGIADAALGCLPNASLLLSIDEGRVTVLHAGPTSQYPADLPTPTRTLALPDRLLLPGLVNAHTHLDLTHIGPVPHDPGDGFVRWVDHIRTNRRQTDPEIAEVVELGVRLSRAGGTIAAGDIAGAPAGRLTEAPAHAMAAAGMPGVSYLEFFGIGKSAPAAIERISAFARDRLTQLAHDLTGSGVRVGFQPHAPNTVDLGVYRWAARLARAHNLPLSTHLAETPEERVFIADGTGPQRELLERLGVWDDSILQAVGQARHPVEHLAPVLAECPVLCAHVNDATDAAIAALAGARTPVVYCPRASAYFGAADHFGPHRYRDMLDAGIPVCLGTDSIVNLDTPDRIGVLDDLRLLHRRDRTNARTLLAMATIHGASALGLDPAWVTLSPGPIAGVIALPVGGEAATDPWEAAMTRSDPPDWLILSRESF